MKKFKLFALVLALSLAGTSFVACSDDDPATGNNGDGGNNGGAWSGELGDAATLVGVWGDPGYTYIKFSADGIMTYHQVGSEEFSASYNYDRAAGTIILSNFSDSADYVEKWEVRRLTKNVLYFFHVWSGFNDGTVDDATPIPYACLHLTDDGRELDVEDSNSAAALVGTWFSPYDQATITFNSDGSAVSYENDPEEGEFYSSGHYSYDPATHCLTTTAYGESDTFRIIVNNDMLIVLDGNYIDELWLRQ